MVFEMDMVLDAPLAADCLSEAAYWLYFASPNIARFYGRHETKPCFSWISCAVSDMIGTCR